MTKRKEVSEKSLELNICSELLQCIRAWPGCGKALWVGLTQAEECRLGVDELIRNTGRGVFLMLQFKAPWPTSIEDQSYKFSINGQQHQALAQLAGLFPKAVHYTFPLYCTWGKAERCAPALAKDTWLVPVASMPTASPALVPAFPRRQRPVELHRVEFRKNVLTSSSGTTLQAFNASDCFCRGTDSQFWNPLLMGVPIPQVREWIDVWGRENFAQRFKGLNAIFIPSTQRA